MNRDKITYKIVCKIQQLILFINSPSSEFSDPISVTLLISSHITIESSTILIKYAPFSQAHILGFHTFHTYKSTHDTFYSYIDTYNHSIS